MGTGIARWGLWLLGLFPGGVFYQFIYSESLFSAGDGFVEEDGRPAVWSGCIDRFSFAVGQRSGSLLCSSDCLALGSAVAGVGLAAAGAQAGIGSIIGKAGGVAVSVVIAVVSGGGLGLLSGFDVALDGKSAFWGRSQVLSPASLRRRSCMVFRGSFLDRLGFLLLLVCLPVMWRRGKDLRAGLADGVWLVMGASLHGLLLWQFVNYRWAGWGEL